MDVQVVIQDTSKLHATINSLRPPQKSDDVPKEILCIVHNEVPVFDAVNSVSADIFIRPNVPESLRDELTRPFTGLLLLAVSTERTRLSIALFPADVTNIAVGKTNKFAFFPGPFLKFLAAIKNARVVLELKQDRFLVLVQTEMANGAVKRTLRASCPYVAEADDQDARSIFQVIPLEKGVRITGEEMMQTLKLIDPNVVTLALHTYITSGAQQQVFTLSCMGDMQYLVMYNVNGTEQPIIDVREAAGATVAPSAAADVDEDLDALKAQCETDTRAGKDEYFGEMLMDNAREYLRIVLNTGDGPKKVRFDGKLGSFFINKKYKLHAHGLVQSKQLIGLLNDHYRGLEHGLSILMGHQHTTSYIVLAMPFAGRGLVLHAVACSIAEEDL